MSPQGRFYRVAFGARHFNASGNHTSNRATGFRVNRQGIFLNALINLKLPARFVIDCFVNINRHDVNSRDNSSVNESPAQLPCPDIA